MKKNTILPVLVIILVILGACSCRYEHTKSGKEKYGCPMKCEADKLYDSAVNCPVCGMELELIDSVVSNPEVTVIGEMRNVMHHGQLGGMVSLDTLSGKSHIYGLGPIEYLTGEILLLDGKCYKSTVVNKDSMLVEESSAVKAPFFGYGMINEWFEYKIPDSISTLEQLEAFLDQLTKDKNRPFFFKVLATVENANIHIVNLPKGSKVSSPEEAHQGQMNYDIVYQEVELIGFFSTDHQAVFTHHDTFLHVHLITADRKKMGHLETVNFKKSTVKLFLPV